MTPYRSIVLAAIASVGVAACSSSPDSSTNPGGDPGGLVVKGAAGSGAGGGAHGGKAGGSGSGSRPGAGGAAGSGDALGGVNKRCDPSGGKTDRSGCSCPSEGATEACYVGDAATAGVGACALGTQSCIAAKAVEVGTLTWGPCTGSVQPATETCDGVDSDCDGKVDDGCACKSGDTDMTGCGAACPTGGGQRTCVGGQWGGCTCKCAAEACSTVCGSGIRNCDASGALGACSVAPITQTCQCSNGLAGTRTCANDQPAACTCPCVAQACTNSCGGGMRTCDAAGNLGPCTVAAVTQACACPSGAMGSTLCENGQPGACQCATQCVTCFQSTCSWAQVAAMNQGLGIDPTQCMASYNQFVQCANKLAPGANVIACDGMLAPGDPQACLSLVRTIVDCAWQTCQSTCMQ